MPHIPTRSQAMAADEDPSTSLSEIVANYDLVSVQSDFVVVSPKQMQENSTAISLADPTVQDLNELGASGGTMYRHYIQEDYNSEMRHPFNLVTYDKMRKQDSTVRKSLRLIKTPVVAARWYMEPASDSDYDKRIADEVWKNLSEGMTITWWQVLLESLGMLDFGHYIFEKVYVIDKGKVRLKKLAPRHPMDVLEWVWDAEGGPQGAWFSLPPSKRAPSTTTTMYPDRVFIPIEKLVVFSFDREANNIQGVSILRSAYKHWYFKEQLYKIDAIQKERHGIGIPIIKLPPGFTKKDRMLANEMGRNLRTNEKAHIVLPPNWELEFAKIEGRPVDALESARHHDELIMGNVLGDFLTGSSTGTAVENQWEVFQKASAFIAEIVKDTMNKWVIPEMVDFNWRVSAYPQLRVRRIGETTDWRTISFALRNFSGAKMLIPDEALEEWIREEMDLPHRDPETSREDETDTPQAPKPSQPRQAAPSAGAPAKTAGQDRSGG